MDDVDATERVGVKHRLRDLREPCRAKRRKVPWSVDEADGVAAELVGEAVEASSGAVDAADPPID